MSTPGALRSLHIAVFVLIVTLSSFLHAEYPVTPLIDEKLPDVTAPGYFTRDNTLYLYGGEDRSNSFVDTFSAVTFDNVGAVTYRSIPSQNGPQVAKPQLVLLQDSQTVLMFGGFYTDPLYNESTPLRIYNYSFNDETWRPLAAIQPGVDPTTLPLNRNHHTAVLATDENVYIFGGAPDNMTSGPGILEDSWSYNPSTGQLTQLQSPPYGLFGHTGTALPDGSILYLGGFRPRTTPPTDTQMGFGNALLYFTSNDTFRQLQLNMDAIGSPPARNRMNGILGPEGRYIYYFGGDDDDASYIRMFFNDLYILDTRTRTWINPTIEGAKPQKRSNGAAGLLSNEYAIFGFGTAGTDYLDTIDVLKLPVVHANTQELDPNSAKWVANVITGQTLSQTTQVASGPSTGVIAAITIVFSVVLFMCIFLMYRYRHRVKRLFMRIHYNIWSPRTGEPLWAETARLISKVVLLFLFIAFFVFVIIQVIQSPKASYSITEGAPGDRVVVPGMVPGDIRICFEGFFIESVSPDRPDRTYPIIQCMTGAGELCFFNLWKLDMSLHSPWFMGNLGNNSCYLFLADQNVNGPSSNTPVSLASTSIPGENNGTELQLAFVPAQSDTSAGRVHISFYHPDRSPLRQFYLNQSSPLLTDSDIDQWLRSDTDDFQVGNTVDILRNQTSTIEYQLERFEYLTDDRWNYVGFAPIHKLTPQVKIIHRTQDNAPNRTDSGGISSTAFIMPASYATIVYREQKIYSLVYGVGFIGGLFGLFVAFQANMFGYRPRSPFGLVHRWSFGEMRSSISEGLKSRFGLSKTPVPLVNPVHKRYSINMRNYGPNYEDDDDEQSTFIDSDSINGFQQNAALHNEVPNYNSFGSDEIQRLALVEDRMQLLELLFKSYYVDDEVFRRLDGALKKSSNSEHRTLHRNIGEYSPNARSNNVLRRLSLESSTISLENRRNKEMNRSEDGERETQPPAVPIHSRDSMSDEETR